MSDSVESLASRFEVLWPHLSERQRRLWLGAEARELGPGGVGIVARAVGVAGDTVRRGRMELQGRHPAGGLHDDAVPAAGTGARSSSARRGCPTRNSA